ncbi:hypothetical protein, partial [Nonomuraea sp. NPDC049784]|uniref:hypothetical protein n=1 Tax=Nonomuraea sp. NPDC049784 TaxID=3154361 RepID=UPI0033CCB337
PAQGDLPPMDPLPGPMPSRIVETPTGPVRVPYDPLTSPSGGHSMPYEGLTSPSGSHRTDQLSPPPGGFDAFGSSSGGQPFGGPSGPHRIARDLDDDSGPQPAPILPLGADSRTSSAATPWPLASADDLREQSRDLSRDISNNRLLTLPSAAPRTGKSRRRPDENDGLWTRGGRPTPLMIVSTLVGIAVVVGAVMVILSGGSASPVAPVTQAATSSPATTQHGEPSVIPAGYTEHGTDGFTAAVPEGWKPATSGGVTTFSGPKDSGIRVTVQKAAPQADGGLAALGKQEAKGGVEGYIQVQLQAAEYRGWRAADWEYTYTTSNGVPMHALTRYVTVDDNNAFKITFDMPELKWDDQAETRTVFLDTFQRAG